MCVGVAVAVGVIVCVCNHMVKATEGKIEINAQSRHTASQTDRLTDSKSRVARQEHKVFFNRPVC